MTSTVDIWQVVAVGHALCYGGSQNLEGSWCNVDVNLPYPQVKFVKNDYTSSMELCLWRTCTQCCRNTGTIEESVCWGHWQTQSYIRRAMTLCPPRPPDGQQWSCLQCSEMYSLLKDGAFHVAKRSLRIRTPLGRHIRQWRGCRRCMHW